MVFLSLKAGFAKLLAGWRIWLVYYLANLVTGMLVILPIRAMLKHFIGDSRMGETLGGPFSWQFFGEFITQNRMLASLLPSVLLTGIIFYVIINLFLSAGAIYVLSHREKHDMYDFWGGCGRYFGRFIRAGLLSVPVMIVLVGFPQLLIEIIESLFLEDAYEYYGYWLNWLTIVIRYFMFVLSLVILDYTRIHIVENDSRKVLRSWGRAIRFTFVRFRRTLTLAFTYVLIGLLGLILYLNITEWLAESGWIAIVLMIFYQQLFMIFRMGVRVSQFASEIYLYHLLGGQKLTRGDQPSDDQPEPADKIKDETAGEAVKPLPTDSE